MLNGPHAAPEDFNPTALYVCAPAINPSRLDLPALSGPMNRTIPPDGISNVTPSRAIVSP
jgi:hypothetical protein